MDTNEFPIMQSATGSLIIIDKWFSIPEYNVLMGRASSNQHFSFSCRLCKT